MWSLQHSVLYSTLLVLLVWVQPSYTRAFVQPTLQRTSPMSTTHRLSILRGGQQQQQQLDDNNFEQNNGKLVETDNVRVGNNGRLDVARHANTFALPTTVSTPALYFRRWYGSLLEANPVFTKSLTAGLIFALSDFLAQVLERNKNNDSANPKKLNYKRTFTSGMVGLCYFGPAVNLWVSLAFKYFPGTGLVSTLKKAVLGQLIFGPLVNCVFFGASLIESGEFSLGNWVNKIKSDMWKVWVAGLGFWPFMDLISYSYIPPQWIPFFINMCSLVWTIYLSTVSNQKAQTA